MWSEVGDSEANLPSTILGYHSASKLTLGSVGRQGCNEDDYCLTRLEEYTGTANTIHVYTTVLQVSSEHSMAPSPTKSRPFVSSTSRCCRLLASCRSCRGPALG